MFNKLYSITGSMLVLVAFNTQGMNNCMSEVDELKVKIEKLEKKLISSEKQKLRLVLNQMLDYDFGPFPQEQLAYLECERDVIFQALMHDKQEDLEKKQIKQNKKQFRYVLSDIIKYDTLFYSKEFLESLETPRQEALKALLNDLTTQADLDEEQGYEKSVDLGQTFAQLFIQEEAQNDAFQKLTQSLAGAENFQNMINTQGLSNPIEEKKPIVIGRWTSFMDWLYGPSNLVDELAKNKLSLEMLKESSDSQDRVNGIIAKCSPSKSRDLTMLSYLVDIYSSLDQLQFKLVNAEINSDIHNACAQWQRDEEIQYFVTRKARTMEIAKLLAQEMKKLDEQEAPRIATIQKLEEIQKLAKQTGMVEQISGESFLEQKHISSLKVLDMVSRLGELSEEIIKEETAQ